MIIVVLICVFLTACGHHPMTAPCLDPQRSEYSVQEKIDYLLGCRELCEKGKSQ